MPGEVKLTYNLSFSSSTAGPAEAEADALLGSGATDPLPA
jgi:hypothetical protein